jgi:Txe/YoeB family toxin of Txe-Axe toxin-antitoxin module
MGGTGSGRKSIKGQAIGLVLDVQILLNQLLNEDLEGNMSREELKIKVQDYWSQTKKVQEELERL